MGTPFCITVDYDSIDSSSEKFQTVTVRKRDSREQDRIRISDLEKYLQDAIEVNFD
ncbi:Glycyl-tRNA synthetase [mine drainage metagenome]|uniref:Glycyl-tRNA synthetase n=1 Tax=mine drainage metagenome TaxID=410659 RepID=T1BHA5_9ZZZZ